MIPARTNVSTHSRPKAAGTRSFAKFDKGLFQLTAARRRLGGRANFNERPNYVSTHSRPKAAGLFVMFLTPLIGSFNSQPPEGGWFSATGNARDWTTVSTHSRPKAAGLAVTGWIF